MKRIVLFLVTNLAVLLVLSVIWDFKVFDQLYILIRTLNRDAANLSIYAYTEAFSSPPRIC